MNAKANASLDQYPILYSGSVKKVRQHSQESQLLFEFTDQVSVFDWGALPSPIPGKGQSLVKMGALFFEALETPARWQEWLQRSGSIAWIMRDQVLAKMVEELCVKGLRTHFRGVFESAQGNALIVEKVNVVRTFKRNPSELIPLEVVFRFELVPGSSILKRRLDLSVGDEFKQPLIEFFTKLESQDRFLNASEALIISGLSEENFQELSYQTQLVASFLQYTFSTLDTYPAGIDLIDGKFEWGLNQQGELMLVDSIGPDELRLLTREKNGTRRDLSKETLREFYRKSEWYEEINRVKESAAGDADWKSKVKHSPPLIPETLQLSIAKSYSDLAKALHSTYQGEKVILIGGGGREHALAVQILKSSLVEEFFWPTSNEAAVENLRCRYPHKKITVLTEMPATVEALNVLAKEAKTKGVTFAVIGPDAYLEAGAVDIFQKESILTFGPTREAAKLEWSKGFAKEVMKSAHVPTAQCEKFDDIHQALSYLKNLSWEKKWVLKADTLAAGKGVEICSSLQEAEMALQRLSKIAKKWIIEEFLEGREVSFFAMCDGESAAMLDPARDFKTLLDDHEGPNTGGMGAISPVADLDPSLASRVHAEVFLPMLKEMQKRNTPFKGLLYAGLMIHPDHVHYSVLEFNARFGDPETQALLPRLKSDLFRWMKACSQGTLATLPARVPFSDLTSVYVVAAAAGYPDAVKKDDTISGIEQWIKSDETFGFFAGIKKTSNSQYVTQGGRVLGAFAMAKTAREATQIAYSRLNEVNFDGKQFRTDVGILKKRIVILASGRGSNFDAIAKSVSDRRLNAKIVSVISNRAQAAVLKKAEGYKINTQVIKEEATLIEIIRSLNVDLIVLAGYDRILSASFINAFRDVAGRSTIINIHPSLLPSFKGLHAYSLAYEAKVKVTGVTIHRVEPELDSGPILAQKSFSIESCTSAEAVERLGLAIEHELYSETLEKLLQGDL